MCLVLWLPLLVLFARSSAALEELRFSGDAYRYQKEAKQYYRKPVQSFITELLQNSLDAGMRVGAEHAINISIAVQDEDVPFVGKTDLQKRVVVYFGDNGVGMNWNVVSSALLRIGASAETRTDVHKKISLTDSAGGFGLAKVLIYLSQDGFDIWTKMKGDLDGIHLEAGAGRHDQETLGKEPLSEAERKLSTKSMPILPTFRSNDRDSHGTLVRVILNPYVMDLGHAQLSPARFLQRQAWTFTSASSIADHFEHVLKKSNLPISVTLQQRNVPIATHLGNHVTKMSFDSGREFGALHEGLKVPPGTAFVALEVLRKHSSKPCQHFLYLFDAPIKSMEGHKQGLQVVLFSEDQFRRSFSPQDILGGTRDRLEDSIHHIMARTVQQYLIDPNLVYKPESKTSRVVDGGLSANSTFSAHFDHLSQIEFLKKNCSWFEGLDKQWVDAYFGGPWRQTTNFSIFVRHEDGAVSELGDKAWSFLDAETLPAHAVTMLQIFGGFVFQALHAMDEPNVQFDLGFTLTKRRPAGEHILAMRVSPESCIGFRSTKDCKPYGDLSPENYKKCWEFVPRGLSGYCECSHELHIKHVPCEHEQFTCASQCGNHVRADGTQHPLYLLNPFPRSYYRDDHERVAFFDEFPDSFGMHTILDVISHLKFLAYHEVAHTWAAEHGLKFIDQHEEVCRKADHASVHEEWTWYHWYKWFSLLRYLRQLQDGHKDLNLLNHVCAMSDAVFDGDAAAVKMLSLQEEREKIKRIVEVETGTSLRRAGQPRVSRESLVEQVRRLKDENERLRARGVVESFFGTILR